MGLWWGFGQPGIAIDKPWTVNESFDFLKIVLAVVGGIGGVVALVVSYRKQRLGETAEQCNQKAEAREDARLFAEDFGRAVEQLGSAEAPVRMAGMYALERLAQNTPEQRQTIANVFCAYLRMPYTPPEDDPAEEHRQDNERRTHEREVRLTAQRILTNNLRTTTRSGEQTDDYWDNLDLDLTGAILINLDFSNCRVNTADFREAEFVGDARFVTAKFSRHAAFNGAEFHGSIRCHKAPVRLDVPDDVRQNRTWPPGCSVTEPTSPEEASLPGSEGRWGYLTRVESDEGDISSPEDQHGEGLQP